MTHTTLIVSAALLSLTACGGATPTNAGPPPVAGGPSSTASPPLVVPTSAPAPVPALAADVHLGDADNSRSVSVTVGEVIELQLHYDSGVGSLGSVNPTVLSTMRVVRGGDHDLAVQFRAVGAGQAAVVVFAPCSGTGCAAALRYHVTIVVTRA